MPHLNTLEIGCIDRIVLAYHELVQLMVCAAISAEINENASSPGQHLSHSSATTKSTECVDLVGVLEGESLKVLDLHDNL